MMNKGETYSIEITVTDKDTAEVLGSGGLPVFSTPAMICNMEAAAFGLAAGHGHQTVGTKVNINHIRACKPGTVVKVTAELIEEDGRRLEFKVSAEDEKGIIGEGLHQRYIIDPVRFMSKLN